MDTKAEFIEGLKDLARFLSLNSDVLDEMAFHSYVSPSLYVDSIEELRSVLKKLNTRGRNISKNFLGGTAYFKVEFTPVISFTVMIAREEVCSKRKVGTRVVPATEAYEEDVYEWDCRPILDDPREREIEELNKTIDEWRKK